MEVLTKWLNILQTTYANVMNVMAFCFKSDLTFFLRGQIANNISVGSVNGLATNMRQVSIWTNVNKDIRWHMASLGHEKLILKWQGNNFVEMSFDPGCVQIDGIHFFNTT